MVFSNTHGLTSLAMIMDNSQHGRLSLLDLIKARLPSAELAFLSAYHSAAGDLSTPDGTIAALQF
jgi:hypothetical protein